MDNMYLIECRNYHVESFTARTKYNEYNVRENCERNEEERANGKEVEEEAFIMKNSDYRTIRQIFLIVSKNKLKISNC